MADFGSVFTPSASLATYVVRLEALEVQASLGIHPPERAGPQRVLINVDLHCNYGAHPPEDRIDAVVDYDFLRAEILKLVASRHFELQETLCDAIAALALVDTRVAGVRVATMKPDIYPDARIGCEVVRRR